MQTSFAEKHFKAEESVTLQNIFSLMANFRDVVSVLPATQLIFYFILFYLFLQFLADT